MTTTLTPPSAPLALTAPLSPLEASLLNHLVCGLTLAEVAAEFHMSVEVVECHLGRVFAKLALPTASELAMHVVALGRSLDLHRRRA